MSKELSDLLNTTARELEQVLSTKTVVGAPITLGDSIVVPLLSVGLGLGMGGGGAKTPKEGEGRGHGIGCGVGVKPIAVIISDKNGVRVEGLNGSAASVLEKVVDVVGKGVDKMKSQPAES